jgi:hypothetical protein
MESRKQAVSIRMNAADVRRIKKIAARLGVRDSSVIRFAVKMMLARLAPLSDEEARGHRLLPVFVESGSELQRFFELDAARLGAIINEGAEPLERVDHDDIALLSLASGAQRYAELRLSGLARPSRAPSEDGEEPETEGAAPAAGSLRDYLYEKYVYRRLGEAGQMDARAVAVRRPGVSHE